MIIDIYNLNESPIDERRIIVVNDLKKGGIDLKNLCMKRTNDAYTCSL